MKIYRVFFMLIYGENNGEPALYTGNDAKHFMFIGGISYDTCQVGQVYVQEDKNRVFGVFDVEIHDNEAFANLIKKEVIGKRFTNIISL